MYKTLVKLWDELPFPQLVLAGFLNHQQYQWGFIQWWFLVPLIGGRGYIITQLAVYTTYIPLMYCLLGGYMLTTTC